MPGLVKAVAQRQSAKTRPTEVIPRGSLALAKSKLGQTLERVQVPPIKNSRSPAPWWVWSWVWGWGWD
jgi:hypothetical protein